MPVTLIIKGKIKTIFNAEIVGQNFEKRVFHLSEGDMVQYPQTYSLECHQNSVNLLDNFSPGDVVECSVEIRGKTYVKDGRELCFNTLKCWQIKLVEKNAQQQAAAPAPAASFNTPTDLSDDLPF